MKYIFLMQLCYVYGVIASEIHYSNFLWYRNEKLLTTLLNQLVWLPEDNLLWCWVMDCLHSELRPYVAAFHMRCQIKTSSACPSRNRFSSANLNQVKKMKMRTMTALQFVRGLHFLSNIILVFKQNRSVIHVVLGHGGQSSAKFLSLPENICISRPLKQIFRSCHCLLKFQSNRSEQVPSP